MGFKYATKRIMAISAGLLLPIALLGQDTDQNRVLRRLTRIEAAVERYHARPEGSIWIESERIRGDGIAVPIWIRGFEFGRITSFSFSVTYDPDFLTFDKVAHGAGAMDWETIDGADSGDGTLTIAGYAGTGAPIVAKMCREVVVLHFTPVQGGASQIIVSNYGDDIEGFEPDGNFIWIYRLD